MADFYERGRANRSNELERGKREQNAVRYAQRKLRIKVCAALLTCALPSTALLSACGNDSKAKPQHPEQPQGDPSTESYVSNTPVSGGFTLVEGATSAALVVNTTDYAGV